MHACYQARQRHSRLKSIRALETAQWPLTLTFLAHSWPGVENQHHRSVSAMARVSKDDNASGLPLTVDQRQFSSLFAMMLLQMGWILLGAVQKMMKMMTATIMMHPRAVVQLH